jgi:hypothetical protein
LDAIDASLDAHTDVLDENTATFDIHGIAIFDAQYMSRSRLDPNTDASNAVWAVLDAQAAVLDDHSSVSATVFKARQVGALWMDVLLVESLSRLQYPRACIPPPTFSLNSVDTSAPISTLPLNNIRIRS